MPKDREKPPGSVDKDNKDDGEYIAEDEPADESGSFYGEDEPITQPLSIVRDAIQESKEEAKPLEATRAVDESVHADFGGPLDATPPPDGSQASLGPRLFPGGAPDGVPTEGQQVDRPMGRFVVEQGFHKGKVFPLNEGTHTLGRGKAADLQILDDAISRKHLEIVVQNGLVVLKDLGSGNGTRVNKERVSERPLVHGDLVELGRHLLRFEEDRTAVTRMLPGAGAELPDPLQAPAPLSAEMHVAGRPKRFWFGLIVFLLILGAVGMQRIYSARKQRQFRELERQAEAARQEVTRINGLLDEAIALSGKGDFASARKRIAEVAKNPAWAERVASARARVEKEEAREKERLRAVRAKQTEEDAAAKRAAEEAQRESQKKREPGPAEMMKQAMRRFGAGEVDQAIALLKKVAGGSSSVRAQAEKSLRDMERFQKAFGQGERALANRDGNRAAKELESAYTLAAEISDDSEAAEQARVELAKAHYLAGNSAFESNPRQLRRARWHYRRVLALDPNSQAGVYSQRMIEEVDQRTERAFSDAQALGDPEERRRRLRAVLEMAEPGSTLFIRAQEILHNLGDD